MKLIEIINQFDTAIQQLETGGAFADDKSYPSIGASGGDLQAYFASLLEELRAAADAGIEFNPIDAVVHSNAINGPLNSFSQFVPQVLSSPSNISSLLQYFTALKAALSAARIIDQYASGVVIQKASLDLQARAIASAKKIEQDRKKSEALLLEAKGHEAALKRA